MKDDQHKIFMNENKLDQTIVQKKIIVCLKIVYGFGIIIWR